MSLKILYTALFCILFNVCLSIAQNRKETRDSLFNVALTTNNDSIKANAYIKFSNYCLTSSPDTSLKYSKLAYELANSKKYLNLSCDALIMISMAYGNLFSYDIENRYLFKALPLAEQLNDSNLLSIIYYNLGTNFNYLKNDFQAQLYYDKALKIALIKKRHILVGIIYNNIGNIYRLSGQYNKAVEYFMQSLYTLQSYSGNEYIGATLISLGQGHHCLGKLDAAKSYLQEGIKYSIAYDDKLNILEGNLELAEIYVKTNYFNKALQLLTKYLSISENQKAFNYSALYCKNLARLYKKMNKSELATIYYEKFINLNDSLKKEDLAKKLLILQKQYESEKKDTQIKIQHLELYNQSTQLMNQKAIIYVISFICFLIALFSVLIYKALRYNKNLNLELTDKNENIESNLEEINRISAELHNQRDELIKLNATKDAFFSIIAHDLRNPIGGMLNLLDLLQNDYNKLNYESVNEIHLSLGKAANQTYILLENLLQWAKSQTGGIDYLQDNISLVRVIKRNIDLISTMAECKNIKIVYECDEQIRVFADINFINTIFRNLLTNAVKFTPNGGNIGVSVETTINEGNGWKYVEICVADNGVGMNKKTIDELFHLTKHSTTNGTNNESGSGLGLILCKEFVERMGGRIWVESEEGKGSKFIFTLPES